MFRLIFTAFVVLLVSQAALCQTLMPSASFSKDSIKIGEEVDYSLSIRYPKAFDMVFPDSTYSFAPFEYISKESFPTKSDSIYSFDSAVYRLTTFEIDSVQILELPIFQVTRGDSILIRPGADSIFLVHIVESIPDSVAMVENTTYSNVKLKFNYPYWIVGITILVVTGIIIFLAFGKAIRRKILLYRLTKSHNRFLERFNTAIQNLGPENIERLLSEWKGYMEKLNKTPYTKLTSKEILEINPDRQLKKSLGAIDQAIYGGLNISTLPDNFDYLRRISEDSFHDRIQKLKND